MYGSTTSPFQVARFGGQLNSVDAYNTHGGNEVVSFRCVIRSIGDTDNLHNGLDTNRPTSQIFAYIAATVGSRRVKSPVRACPNDPILQASKGSPLYRLSVAQ